MTQSATPHVSAMESKGAYNRHASLPAAANVLAAPLLERAAREVPLDHSRPVVIADYGVSQGKNSLTPMRVAIAALRDRTGPERSICLYHTDLPANDFSQLFEILENDP